jgi:hypothetical protein
MLRCALLFGGFRIRGSHLPGLKPAYVQSILWHTSQASPPPTPPCSHSLPMLSFSAKFRTSFCRTSHCCRVANPGFNPNNPRGLDLDAGGYVVDDFTPPTPAAAVQSAQDAEVEYATYAAGMMHRVGAADNVDGTYTYAMGGNVYSAAADDGYATPHAQYAFPAASCQYAGRKVCTNDAVPTTALCSMHTCTTTTCMNSKSSQAKLCTACISNPEHVRVWCSLRTRVRVVCVCVCVCVCVELWCVFEGFGEILGLNFWGRSPAGVL